MLRQTRCWSQHFYRMREIDLIKKIVENSQPASQSVTSEWTYSTKCEMTNQHYDNNWFRPPLNVNGRCHLNHQNTTDKWFGSRRLKKRVKRQRRWRKKINFWSGERASEPANKKEIESDGRPWWTQRRDKEEIYVGQIWITTFFAVIIMNIIRGLWAIDTINNALCIPM